MKSPRYVCFHGHFYQPPRESPWLEAIERQKSAWPAHDWNERVTEECYAPNSHARVLDGDGSIVAIHNNYARMSFNFGPTLLSWMEVARPDVYAAIVEADRQSVARFDGHGSAMAQVYNHMILPLASPRDKVTQVRWGIRDFERRFGRKPSGMWLAETAVDLASLEVLAAHGIRFTVLAPHQCRRVRSPGGEWRVIRNQDVDPRRPYLAKLPSGREIALFFYDGPTSRAVAFERLLDDGHRFASRLLEGFDARREPQLVHIATDGETYGHHHAYGEMALAVALDDVERQPDVSLVNYPQLLSLVPPTWEAEIEENTSWSCVHGVERWRSDCGCNSGTGWHQRWRAPLRQALDWLSTELASCFEKHAGVLLKDPWEARDEYIDVVLDRSKDSVDVFFETHGVRALSVEERRRALTLLEMQRHAMLMYTSCGWFFDEPSGLETVQVLRYAARALELATETCGDRFEPGFRERLAKGPSNRAQYGDMDGVYEAFVTPSRVDLAKVGAHFAIGAVFEGAPPRPSVGGLDGELIEVDLTRTGATRLAIGRLRVASRITTETDEFSFAVLHFGDHNLLGGIRRFVTAPRHVEMHEALSHSFARADVTEVVRQIERLFEGETFSLRSLFHDEQAAILERLLAQRATQIEETYASIYDSTAPLMRFLESVEQPAPAVFRAAAEYTIMARLRRALEAGSTIDLRRVGTILDEASTAHVALDPLVLGRALQRTLERALAALSEAPEDDDLLLRVAELTGFAAESPWKIELREAQTIAWRLLPSLVRWRQDGRDDPRARGRAVALEAVLRHLGIRVPAAA